MIGDDLSTIGKAAIAYAQAGFAIFPLQPRSKEPFEGSHGFKDATTNVNRVYMWWRKCPDANIGMAMGAASGGVFAVDVDDNHEGSEIDGSDSLIEWEEANGELPRTREHVTGSGGVHMLYRCPSGVSVRSTGDVIPSVQIKADGGYIVMPPSVHPNGNRYEVAEDCEIAEADSLVLKLASERGAQESAAFELPERIPNGERNDTLFRFACSLQAQGMKDGLIAQMVSNANKAQCDEPLSDGDIKKLLGSALKYDKGEGKTEDAGKAIEIRDGRVELQRGDAGPYQNNENAWRICAMDPELEGHIFYDVTAYTKMLALPVPWDSGEGARPVADDDYTGLALFAERKYGYKSRVKLIDMVSYVARRNRVNPIAESLRKAAEEWDGEPRIATMFSDCLGVKRGAWSEIVGTLFCNGAVSRAFRPGTKFDYVPILVGAQGIGKSWFCEMLAMNAQWFCGNFATVEGDAAAEKLRGVWIAEMAELLADKRARGVESMKAFITATVDTIRPKYARETEQRPRCCVFVGTTNDESFLHDPTGNRRFLPVKCGEIEPTVDMWDDGAAEYFRQVWGEAAHGYIENGGKVQMVLPHYLDPVADAERERYTEDDPLPGMVAEFVSRKIREMKSSLVTVDEADTPTRRMCVQQVYESTEFESMRRGMPEKPLRRSIGRVMHTLPNIEFRGVYTVAGYGKQRCFVWNGKDGDPE